MPSEYVDVYGTVEYVDVIVNDGHHEVIEVGIAGPQGAKGEKGDPGEQGERGEPGPASVPGFYSGMGPPNDDVLGGAASGSTYLDLSTFDFYTKD